jgi:CIC family chloride channel protein
MRPHFRYGFLSVQSVVIASGMSALVLRRLTNQAADIPMPHFGVPPLDSFGLFLLLGVLFGVIGYGFNAALVGTLDVFSHLRGRLVWIRGLSVGAAVGIVAWKFPQAVGEGYQAVQWALKSEPSVRILLAIFAARFVAGMLCYGCGAPGGIFAPMLALATLFGLAYGKTMVAWCPDMEIKAGMFAVAGMGALFAATVRAPLTGIALTIELTQNYEIVLPLILTCWAATIVAQGLGARPIYTVLLERTLRNAGTSGPSPRPT